MSASVCVSANPPCLFRSVYACLLYASLGGSLQVPEHPLKKSKESPEKCDDRRLQVDKRSWGVWDHAANKFGFGAFFRRPESEVFAGQSMEERGSRVQSGTLEKVGADFLPHVLCIIKGEFCMIDTPRSY